VKLRLLVVGQRPAAWVSAGFQDYARRMPREMALELTELPAFTRKNVSVERARRMEGDRMLERLGPRDQVVALDVGGRAWTTADLVGRLEQWRMLGRDVTFLVGGADGLDPRCLGRADEVFSLSALTFPHGLVRIILAEQLYRAWTIASGHPYHRA
jgi:23S rRNA (pseudouridine1915-N3)-methyltransferase